MPRAPEAPGLAGEVRARGEGQGRAGAAGWPGPRGRRGSRPDAMEGLFVIRLSRRRATSAWGRRAG